MMIGSSTTSFLSFEVFFFDSDFTSLSFFDFLSGFVLGLIADKSTVPNTLGPLTKEVFSFISEVSSRGVIWISSAFLAAALISASAFSSSIFRAAALAIAFCFCSSSRALITFGSSSTIDSRFIFKLVEPMCWASSLADLSPENSFDNKEYSSSPIFALGLFSTGRPFEAKNSVILPNDKLNSFATLLSRICFASDILFYFLVVLNFKSAFLFYNRMLTILQSQVNY